MFQRAQERFAAGQAIGVRRNGYASELMKQYGNAGKKWELPDRNDKAFDRAFEHYRKEQAHYTGMQQRLHEHQEEMNGLRAQLFDSNRQRDEFATFIDQNFQPLDTAHVDSGDGVGSSVDIIGGGDSVLPALQTDADDGPSEAVNSSNVTNKSDGRNRRRGPTRSNDAKGELGDNTAHESQRGDGGSPSESPDPPEPVAGRQASEHVAEE